MGKFSFTALAGSLVCLGCGEHRPESLATATQPVESAQRGVFYDVAFAPARSLTELIAASPGQSGSELAEAFERELSAQGAPYWSSGSITVPALTQVGGQVLMAPAPATSRIRYSCGATLISPSFAITAGHCVTPDTKLDELRLQLYRPSAKLADVWQKASVVSGTWPELQHPKLDADDGYLLDEYPCVVRTRCYDSNLECLNDGDDVALLECEGRPGDKYGFLNVSTAAAAGQEALMHWKHEVLDVHVAEPIPQDWLEHYVLYPPSPDQNFHYFEAENQLLPLRSIPWPDGSTPRFLTANTVDVHGCHGSSGSGILARRDDSPEYRLVGPAAIGGRGLTGRLCDQVPNPDGAVTGPGTMALGIRFVAPQTLLEQYAAELVSDCRARQIAERDLAELPFAPGSHRPATLFSFLSCQLADFAHAGTVAAAPSFGPYPEMFVDDDAAAGERVISGFQLEAEADYRMAFQAQSLGACASCPPPQLRQQDVVSSALVKLTQGRTLLTTSFAAQGAGPVEIGISHANSQLAVGGFTLIREGQVNSFDVPEDRLEAALYALDDSAEVVVGPAPMRFVGDGSAGFEALLLAGERVALLRQALGPGHRWTVRLGASSYSELECGLLDLTSAPVLRVPCAAVLTLDDSAGADPRLGFFIELAKGSLRQSADIQFVALASEQARDPDGDQVPDVLDNCPGDWNAAQAECNEEPREPGAGGAAGASGHGNESGANAAGAASDAEAGRASIGGSESAGAPPVAGGSSSTGGGGGVPAEPADASGCSCRVPAPGTSPPTAALALLGLLLGCGSLRRHTRWNARSGAAQA